MLDETHVDSRRVPPTAWRRARLRPSGLLVVTLLLFGAACHEREPVDITRVPRSWQLEREPLDELEAEIYAAALSGAASEAPLLSRVQVELDSAMGQASAAIEAARSAGQSAPPFALQELREQLDAKIAAREQLEAELSVHRVALEEGQLDDAEAESARSEVKRLTRESEAIRSEIDRLGERYHQLQAELQKEDNRAAMQVQQAAVRLDALIRLHQRVDVGARQTARLSPEAQALIDATLRIDVEHGVALGGKDGNVDDTFTDCVAVLKRIQPTAPGGKVRYAAHGTGVLIAPRLVLTARHVLEEADLVVYRGPHVDDADATSVIPIELRHTPDIADPRGPDYPDIAVLVLTTRVDDRTFTKFATTDMYAGLATGATKVFVAGYGKSGKEAPGRKRGGEFVPEPDPHWVDHGKSHFDPATELILIDKRDIDEIDTSEGDSGGPAYFLWRDNKYYLGGITARGFVPKKNPHIPLPGGIYVRVDRYGSWLEELTGRYR